MEREHCRAVVVGTGPGGIVALKDLHEARIGRFCILIAAMESAGCFAAPMTDFS